MVDLIVEVALHLAVRVSPESRCVLETVGKLWGNRVGNEIQLYQTSCSIFKAANRRVDSDCAHYAG